MTTTLEQAIAAVRAISANVGAAEPPTEAMTTLAIYALELAERAVKALEESARVGSVQAQQLEQMATVSKHYG